MPAFDGPPPVIFDGPSPAVSILPGFSPIVSPFRPSLQGEEYVRPAGLFAAPRAPGLVEAPEVPPGLPAPVAPIAAVPALVEDMLAPVENASAPVENAPAPVDDTTAPLHDTLFLSEDARFRSLEADRVSGAASVAPRPAHPRVQSPDAPERPASAPPVTPETVDTTPEMISGVLKWREGGEVRRAVLQSPEDWVTSPKSVEGTLANGEQVRDAGLQVEVENVQQVEHDAPASEETTSAQVSTPSSENNPQEPTHPAPQRHKPRRPKTTIFVLGGGLPARATHR
ncbi:uncharacterized protein SCHCODRAFT_02515303 [Schizophyllum commune H4-8]|uniref:Expressed protein n=1 Tax=Schizophyllum commune (strain H4-8 / FGSC 9210) TaxID=578458 RepID=D8QF27_SCHCM|nr:uncharacterized protein SCHCODRAFT_02515303 [Schizophyllum commune H4-8]KAI5887455.1 hypothetical protein SCHCODRAFT_02515303 [Schizophyllum commune H4-8]